MIVSLQSKNISIQLNLENNLFILDFSPNTARITSHKVCNTLGPLFTKRTDVLPQDIAKSRSWEIRFQTFPIALNFERHIGSTAAEMPVKLQSDKIIITLNSITRLRGNTLSYHVSC